MRFTSFRYYYYYYYYRLRTEQRRLDSLTAVGVFRLLFLILVFDRSPVRHFSRMIMITDTSVRFSTCVRSTSLLPQWHVKDLGHSAKTAGGRLHLNIHTPLTQRSRSGLTMPLSMLSVGTYQETSSHATRQGTLGHSRLSSLSHRGLILPKRVELVCAS